MPLSKSIGGGARWPPSPPPIGGRTAAKTPAGPLPPTGNVRPLVVGTNTGLFASTDNGVTFNSLSGGALLPATDYTQVSFITDHYDRFYAASDGGGSRSGGLWRSNDAGQSFVSLQPPEASVTALAVSNDAQPVLYVATFHPSPHTPSLWVYHHTSGPPHGPPSTETPVASGSRTTHPGSDSIGRQILGAPEWTYVGPGIGALAIVMTAVVAPLRGRDR